MEQLRLRLNGLFRDKTFLGIGIGTWVFILLFFFVLGILVKRVPALRKIFSKIPIIKNVIGVGTSIRRRVRRFRRPRFRRPRFRRPRFRRRFRRRRY